MILDMAQLIKIVYFCSLKSKIDLENIACIRKNDLKTFHEKKIFFLSPTFSWRRGLAIIKRGVEFYQNLHKLGGEVVMNRSWRKKMKFVDWLSIQLEGEYTNHLLSEG